MKLPAILDFQNKDTRYPFFFLVLMAIAALLSAIYFYFTGQETVMPWQTVSELQSVSMPADRFNLLLHTFNIQVRGHLLTQRFEVGLPVINTLAAQMLLCLLALSSVYYLTVISTFRQIPFFIGILLWMLFLTSFNFDLLGIFRSNNQYILLATLILTGSIAFLFQAFLDNISFRIRLLIFGLLIAGLGVFLFQASPFSPAQTTLHLVNYSSLGAIIAAALFILWVAYEIIHGLLWFNTQSQYPGRRYSLWQFLLISGLYLLNLLLLYLKNTNLLALDITLLNAFMILIFSAVVGFWGTKRRETLYHQFISFESGAAFLYLVLAIITAVSISYAFATANDPLIRAFTDFIIYTHLAFGTIFLVYILLNFGTLIRQRLRVFRVVYDPKIIPYYTVYILGFILLASLLLRGNFTLHRQATAGYYNYLGDFYKGTNDLLLAERFYTEGNVYDNYNIKSTYALASIYHEKSYLQSEINLLKDALRIYPSDKIYTRLANKYTERDRFFDQMFLLREGLKLAPNSAPLLNNQALLYASTAMVDSTEYFFNLAHQHTNKPEVIQSNRLAFYLQTGLGRQATEMAQQIHQPTYAPLQSNLLLLQGFNGTKSLQKPRELPAGKTLSPEQFALIYHAVLQGQTVSNKESLVSINQYLASEDNQAYHFDLSVLKAFVQNRLNQTLAARTTLENLAATEPDYAGYLLDLIGLQLMQQKLYMAAADHFEQAVAKGWPDANLHLLYALVHQPARQVDALLQADKLKTSENPEVAHQATNLGYLLQTSATQLVLETNDSLKVQYLQLNQDPTAITEQEFLAIMSTVNNPALRKIAQKELASFYVTQGNLPAAIQTIQALLPQLSQQDQLLSEVNILQAEILLRQNNLEQLNQALSRMYLTGQDQQLKYYYQAQLAERQNRTPEAKKYYDLALQALPYHEPTVLAASNFYSGKMRNNGRAYDLLINSITYNRYAPAVYKAYILKSIEVGYSGFAETALEELANLIPADELAAFRVQYEQKLSQRQAALQIRQ